MASSRLEMLQARFQQRQLAEKEQKLLQLYDQQQLRAHQVAQRGSAGSNGSGHGNSVSHHQTMTRTSTSTHSTSNSQGGGKVRQMFDERRHTTVKGIDKSYPLEPLENRTRRHQTTTNNIFSTSSPLKNSNRQTVVTRKTVRSEANSNVNGGKPVVTYHEEVSREINNSADRDNEQEEFGDDNYHVSQYENGNIRRIDRPSELDIEDETNENSSQRHRTTAKIQLKAYDNSDRTNLDDEPFLNDDEIVDRPERLSRRSSTDKKSSQAEARLDRFKTTNANKKIGQTIKQNAGNTTSITKRRNDSFNSSGSSSRISTVTKTVEAETSNSPSRDLTNEKSRNASPEVSETKFTVTGNCQSPTTKTSGVTKVSQLFHGSPTDYYPRRKSEFEKSKTFRKLQLELGESSPEPNEPDDDTSIPYGKPCKKRSSILDENIYSTEYRSSSSRSPTPRSDSSFKERKSSIKTEERRHSKSSTFSSRQHTTSPRQTVDRDFPKERKSSDGAPQEGPGYRQETESPTFESDSSFKERKSSIKSEDRRHSESSTFSSRQHTTSPRQTVDRDFPKERKSSDGAPQEGPGYRQETESPTFESDSSFKERKSSIKTEDRRHSESSTFSSRQHTTAPKQTMDRDFPNERKPSDRAPQEGPGYRQETESPSFESDSSFKERKSSIKTDDRRHSESSTFSSRQHTTAPKPTVDRDFSNERKPSDGAPQEGPGYRQETESPTSGRKSVTKEIKERKISGGIETSNQETGNYSSSTFSSRRHSSKPFVENEYSFERETTYKITVEEPESPRSPSPVYGKESLRKNVNCKISEDTKRPNVDSSHYSTTLHFSTTVDRKIPKDRKISHEKPHEAPRSRSGSSSPTRRRGSTPRDEEKRETGGMKSSNVEKNSYSSSSYSSKRRSSSSKTTADQATRERKTSTKISNEDSGSRQGSPSPTNRKHEEFQTSNIESRAHSSSNYFSKRRTSPSKPTEDHKFPKDRKSPERTYPGSREGSKSPTFKRKSVPKDEEKQIIGEPGLSQMPSSTFSSRQHYSSPCAVADTETVKEHKIINNREESDTENRRKSSGTLRSFELVKKLVRPSPSPERKSPPKVVEHKITLEDIEFPEKSSNLRRSKSPDHKTVKKDKATLENEEEEERPKTQERKNSRDKRSRTTSPSPPSSSTLRETVSFRAKKNERKSLPDEKKNEDEDRHLKSNNANPSVHEKAACDSENAKNQKDSRRSSSDITVRRHDTFKVSKPSQKIIDIDKPQNTDKKNEDSSVQQKACTELKDKSPLLERIEKIRSTLSRSGRSEQNLQSKDFERTDSVESALKRFDSIGVETEHHVTVGGIDETDYFTTKHHSSEPVLTSNNKETFITEKIVLIEMPDKPLKESEEVKIALIRVQPAKINANNRVQSTIKSLNGGLREKPADPEKSVNTKKQKAIKLLTPRRSDDKIAAKLRVGQKSAASNVKKSKLRSEESSGRGETKNIDGSPDCKRKLFQDSESEIENENSQSTVVLRTVTRTRKGSPEIVEIETRKNLKNTNRSLENILQAEMSTLADAKNNDNEPAKLLRSIEDIRKSIKRESQDFKRELDKFNTAMKKDVEISSKEISPDSTATRGIVSRVQITKTYKSGDREPVVKIERSTVKLPIDHRVAKSPSPDIGTKRSLEAKTTTTTTSVRRNVPSTLAKSSDTSNRYGSTEMRIPATKSFGRTSSSPGARESKNHTEYSITTEYADYNDGPMSNSQVIEASASMAAKKNNEAFVVDLGDDEVSKNNQNRGKLPTRKSMERSVTTQKQQRSPTSTPIPRPNSALSTASSVSSTRGRSPQTNSKIKMATKTKTPGAKGAKAPSVSEKSGPAEAANDGLSPCKICGRRFNSDRISLHEQICSKTATKKRKTFDATTHRVKGTELEPFVKKGALKKSDRKAQKPEVKSNWRRKHEDFINAIRSAKQVQAHLAAGGKLSDLPPPPPSDTSDYIQCPHCGRKFNQGAADRHIPKCATMMHNKPNPRAPPKPKR